MSMKAENLKPTRYIHLRTYDRDGNMLPTGGLCIAYDTVKDGDKEDLFCAFARCSKKDVYNRVKARMIAEGRLTKWLSTNNPKLTIIRLNGRKPREAIMDVLKAASQQHPAVKEVSKITREAQKFSTIMKDVEDVHAL